jgi:hypothetical protein
MDGLRIIFNNSKAKIRKATYLCIRKDADCFEALN